MQLFLSVLIGYFRAQFPGTVCMLFLILTGILGKVSTSLLSVCPHDENDRYVRHLCIFFLSSRRIYALLKRVLCHLIEMIRVTSCRNGLAQTSRYGYVQLSDPSVSGFIAAQTSRPLTLQSIGCQSCQDSSYNMKL